MSGYAGPVCPKCHCGMIGCQDLRVSDHIEEQQRKRYGSMLCDNCKREAVEKMIAEGRATAADLPGFYPTIARK